MIPEGRWQRVSDCKRNWEAGPWETACATNTPAAASSRARHWQPDCLWQHQGDELTYSCTIYERNTFTCFKCLPGDCQSADQRNSSVGYRCELTLFPQERQAELICVTAVLVIERSHELSVAILIQSKIKGNSFSLYSALISRLVSKAHVCICKTYWYLIHAAFYSMLNYCLITLNFFFSSNHYLST